MSQELRQNLTFLTTLAVGLLVAVVVVGNIAVVVAVNVAVDFEEPTVEDDLANAMNSFTASEGDFKIR